MAPADRPLDPNRQLRWALEHLPSPASTREEHIEVDAPSLEGDELVRVPFSRARIQVEGREVEGWVHEGAVSIHASGFDDGSGYPGAHAWIKGALGPYCVALDVLEDRGAMARVRIFGTTRELL